MAGRTKFKTVNEYIAASPADSRKILREMQMRLKNTAPSAEEVISYNMPALKINRILVWYAAYKEHIGFYPGTAAIEHFKFLFSKYKWSKGAVQFPINKPLPFGLIVKIVKYRVQKDLELAKEKKEKKRKVN